MLKEKLIKLVKNKSRGKSRKAKKMNGNYWERYEEKCHEEI